MDERIIAERLGVQTRSIRLIMMNEGLCERIMNESPIRIKDFADKYLVSLNSIRILQKEGKISSFSNSPNKGSIIFIFEEETLSVIKPFFYKDSRTIVNFYKKGIRMILSMAKDILTERQYEILKMLYQDGYTIEMIAEKWMLTKQRVIQIESKTVRKLSTYRVLKEKYDDVMKRYIDIKAEYDFLMDMIKRKTKSNKIKYVKTEYGTLSNEILNTPIDNFDISVRVINCMRNVDIITIRDLIQYKREDFLKFRNFGKVSLAELDNLIKSLGLNYNTVLYDIDV